MTSKSRVVVATRKATPEERTRLERELVALIADVLERRRRIAA